MSRSRKTIKVDELIDYCNKQLARIDYTANKDFKAGICVMLFNVLSSTNNYNGFAFNNPDRSDINDDQYYSRTYFKPLSK
jgi:hypothetical protein